MNLVSSPRTTSRASLAALACAAIAVCLGVSASAQTADTAASTKSANAADEPFTVERLDRWLSAARPRPPVKALADSTVRWVVERGAADERLLYPTRIAQQLSLSLEDWHALTRDVAELADRFRRPFFEPRRLEAAASALHTWGTMVNVPWGRMLDAFLRRRAEVYALATAAAAGDREAAERYAGLAADMAADSFMRDVFRAATLQRTVTADLRAMANDETYDDLLRWRAIALAQMLEARSAEGARAAFARVEANTVGPVPDPEPSRSYRSGGGAADDREPRTRIVTECNWVSVYETDSSTGEPVWVDKRVCEEKEIEY